MAEEGYPGTIEGSSDPRFDVTNNAGNFGAGGGFNTGAGSKPATLDISVSGGFLQGTGSVADNLFNDVQHGGGTIVFPSASLERAIDRTKYPSSRYSFPSKQRTRFRVKNERQIELSRPLHIYDKTSDRFIAPELDSSLLQFSMSFETTVMTPVTSSIYLGSYADITLGNLRAYSGDIHRMKVYAKHGNDASEQENRIGDFIVQDKNELINRNSPSGQTPIGTFWSQSVVDNHWISSSNCDQPIQKNDSEIISAVLLSGSNYGNGEFFDFKTKDYVPLVKNQDYIVNFSSYFVKKPKQQPDGSVQEQAKIEVLLSGSVQSPNQELLSLGTISGEGDDSSETLEGKISGSIPNLFNYVTTYAGLGLEPSASLVFRVHAGEFHVGKAAIRPLKLANFHPDSYRVKLPMPKKAPRNQQYNFRVEFYDFDNNKSQFTTESTASVFFTGANDVLDGLDNYFEGAQLWGNAMEIYGVSGNSAYMRSVGYQGFEKTRAGTGERNGGFMIFSGSIGTRITASEAYDGVGIEIVDASAGPGNPGQHKYLQFRSVDPVTGEARFRVQTDEFYFGQDRTQPNAQFVSGSEGKIEISSSNFHLDNDGSVVMQGTITAEAGGTIGGFTIGSDNLTATDFVLNTTNKSLSLGSGNTIFIADADDGIQLGHATFASAPFSVTPAGVLKAESGTIGGFTLSSNELTATNFELNPSGKRITLGTGNSIFIADGDEGIQLGNSTFASAPFSVTTAGVVKAESGTIGGWTLSSTTLTGGTITLDSSGIIEVGGLTGISDTTNTGFYVDNSGQILIRQSGTDFLKFSGGSLEMKARTFDLDANSGDLKLDSVNKRISINDSTFGNAGVQLEHDTGTGKFYAGDGSSKFIQFDGSDVNIQSDDFLLSTSTLIIDSSTNNGKIALGTSATNITETDNTGVYIDGNGKFRIGTATSGTDYLHFDGSSIDIKTQAFELETNNLDISSTNERIDLGDGKIILQGAATSTITIGASDSIVLSDNGTDRFIKFGDKTDFAQTGTEGLIMGTNNGNAEFDMTIGTGNNNYLRADSSGIDIATPNFELNTLPLDISSTNKRIQIFDALGTTEYIRIGEISYDAATKYGIQVWDGTGTDSATDLIAMFGQAGNKIAGWNFTDTQIRTEPAAGLLGSFAEDETGLIIHSDGKIETSDFATGLKGWRISSEGNGTAEFENARIRGTLRTTVFEKESVNVVGGQLMIANSTTFQPLRNSSGSLVVSTGPAASSSIGIADVTMSMANVTGFTSGSIIKAKKVDDTGFSVEYMHVEGNQRFTEADSPISASLAANTSGGFMDAVDPDGLAGFVFVSRAYGAVTSPSGSSAVTTLDENINTSVTSFDVVDGSVFSVQDIIKIGNAGDDERMKVTKINSNTITVVRDFQDTTAQSHTSTDPIWVIDTSKEFLVGLVSTAQTYNEGQVFVDTGKYVPDEDISSGYILMNANPNDTSTPYMDIVERTGSGVYDLQLRSRLGDLSGLSSAYLYGDDEPGFGLYTENAFFRGAITAQTGSIAGILNVATTQGGLETGQKITIGRNIGNTKRLDTQASQTGQHDGFRINENNYWLTTAEFRIGNDNNYLHISGTEASQASQFKINTKELEVKVDGTNGRSLHDLEISSAETSMSFSDKELVLKAGTHGGTNAGFIQVGDNRAIEITGSNNLGVIRSKKTSFTDDTAGFWLANDNGTQEFYIGTATEHLKFNGSVISLAGSNIALTADNVDVTTGTFEVDADDFQLSSTNQSASFGYDTNADAGIVIKGGDPSYIYFGSKTSPPLKIVSDDQVGVNEHYLSTNNKDFGDTTAGIIIGSDATTQKLEIYKDSNEYLTYSSADGFDLQTTKIELSTGQGLTISGRDGSTATNNKILLGSATDINTGDGFFVDGGGNFRVGGASNNFVKFTGGTLEVNGDITVSNPGDFAPTDAEANDPAQDNPSNYSFGGDATFPLNALPGTITTAGLYLGSNNLGYHDGSVYKTYMDSSGNFYLGGTSGALQWSSGTLTITGNITFTNSPNISTFTNDSGFTDDTVANSKPSVFRQTSQPSTSSPVGSLWYDTDDDNKLYVLVSGSPNVWTPTQDGDIATAQSAADAAQSTADSRPKVFRQTSAPSTSEPGGSLWYDTNDDNKLYILVSSTWTPTRDGQITTALADAAAAQSTATTVSDDLQDVIDGVSVSGAGTFIDANVIYSPLIAGTNGYISNVFKVGNAGITLDGVNKKIYIGTGTYNNSNTAFYVDSTNNFSLGNKLTFDGADLTVSGEITATSGEIGGWTINSNSLTGGDVTLKSAGLMGISGSTTVGGSSVTTNILMDTDASKGSEIALQREDFGGDLTNFVELHTSQSYFENNIVSYVSGSTRDNKDFTKDPNDNVTVLMSGTGAGAWASNVYLRSDGSDLDDILIANTIATDNQLLDTGETNLITEIQLQNLTERAGGGSGKSLFRWKGEVFQNDTNSITGAELVGSFRISSVLSLSEAASPLNISSKFLLTKRYFYVKITGTDYDVLDGNGVESWTLNSSGTAPQIQGTKYLPRVITSGIGQQFFAGPNQEAKFGAKNEVIGNFKVKETLAGTAGDIVAEGKLSVGTFDIDDTFDLFVDGAIGATGNIVGFYSSDKRLKENIVEIKDGLSLINQLRPVKFDWKQDSPFGHLKPTEYGLIAQEVQEVIPEIVGHMKDDYKGINYEKIVPLLISSIQQLTKRVEELEQDK